MRMWKVNDMSMTEQQRRDAASQARRKVQTRVERDLSFFEKMDDAAKEEFFKKEKARSLKVIRARKIRTRITIAIGVSIAAAVSFLVSDLICSLIDVRSYVRPTSMGIPPARSRNE